MEIGKEKRGGGASGAEGEGAGFLFLRVSLPCAVSYF